MECRVFKSCVAVLRTRSVELGVGIEHSLGSFSYETADSGGEEHRKDDHG